ncbi:MAG: ribosomal-protein-alanine N-acetyltransferase [Chloroflexi bacterium RBG_16_64_43]|nr:MAG: ribosomal-protein-alanine N-acetyltransferase [Chloroflexi bacterium RBG_16_64_43]
MHESPRAAPRPPASGGVAGLAIRAMHADDIPRVMAIDSLSFPNPWPETTYRFEISENPSAHLLVLEVEAEPLRMQVVGFAGYWFIIDEAHISTLAIHPNWRGRGLAQVLLRALLREAAQRGALSATLEVRRGNRVAQRLYERHGFAVVGRRLGYYSDNSEDALLMTTHEFDFPLADTK